MLVLSASKESDLNPPRALLTVSRFAFYLHNPLPSLSIQQIPSHQTTEIIRLEAKMLLRC